MSKRTQIILAICSILVYLGISILTNILESSFNTLSEEAFGKGKDREFILFGALFVISVIAVVINLLEKRNSRQNERNISIDFRQQLLNNLEDLYKDRLKAKMNDEMLFEIKLNLNFTKEGTSQKTSQDFIIKKESQVEDFENLFNKYNKELYRLLILGEPGAGKSILLLKFGLKLIELARADSNYRIPIILDLTTWRRADQTFEYWLEQNLPYIAGSITISKDEARRLVEANALLPLLDGFDEIQEVHRNSCLEKLRLYLEKVQSVISIEALSLPEVIICSRILEYRAAGDAPVFAAVKIQPLQREDIQSALNKLIDKNVISAKRLKRTLDENAYLYRAITSAFFLHTLLNIYTQEKNHIFFCDSKELLQKEITETYIRLELEKLTDFPIGKVKKWLGWLAYKMKYNAGIVTFELADMQPQWTKSKYSFNFVFGLVFGLAFGLIGILVAVPFLLFSNSTYLLLIGGMGNGLFIVLCTKAIGILEIQKLCFKDLKLKIFWSRLISTLAFCLTFISLSLCLTYSIILLGFALSEHSIISDFYLSFGATVYSTLLIGGLISSIIGALFLRLTKNSLVIQGVTESRFSNIAYTNTNVFNSRLIGAMAFSLPFGLMYDLNCVLILGIPVLQVLIFAFFILPVSLFGGMYTNRIYIQEIHKLSFKKIKPEIFWSHLIFVLTISLSMSLLFDLTAGLIIAVIGLINLFSVKESFPKIDKTYKRLLAQFWRDILQGTLISAFFFGFIQYFKFANSSDKTMKVIFFGDVTYEPFLIGAFAGGLISFLVSPIFMHLCLRIILFFETVIPMKLVIFLDSVADYTGLLTKNGGQWRFRHQLIHDSLANWFEENHSNLLKKEEKAKVSRPESTI